VIGTGGMRRLGAALLAAGLLLTACGDDEDDVTETGGATSTTAGGTTTAEPSSTTTSTPAPVGLEQPALWPAAEVVFATPEEAAEDFVREVLGVEPTLGAFQQGDARSGEIAVASPGEGGGADAVVRGTLLLRQLGPDDGWFVLAVASDVQTFAAPSSGEEVPAGPLTVSASGRGFEATVVVSARIAGRSGPPLDQVVAQGGAFADPAPFTVELDLGGAEPGDTVILLLQGGVGLEEDPGEVAAIPVVIR
jgi:hypothetical protein